MIMIGLLVGGWKSYKGMYVIPRVSEVDMAAFANNITISNPIPVDTTLPIYSLSVSGKVNLIGESGLVRVVLVDTNNQEYLAYETYSAMSEQSDFAISSECEETCVLDGITPKNVRVETDNASFSLDNVHFILKQVDISPKLARQSLREARARIQLEKSRAKFNRIKLAIVGRGNQWEVAETSISKMTYAEKKKLFARPGGGPVVTVPNLQGFEYYKGGVFTIPSNLPMAPTPTASPTPTAKPTPTSNPTPVSPTPTTSPSSTPTPSNSPISFPSYSPSPSVSPQSSAYPMAWDWRNRHGQNWVSPVKNQLGCGSCWAFAGVSTTEAAINLYYNQPLNIDLSEQDSVCRHPGSCQNGGYLYDTLNELRTTGLVSETCYPYTGTEACGGKCRNWKASTWKLTNFVPINVWPLDDTIIRQTLITKGPFPFGILSWWHFMTVVGYDTNYPTNQSIWIVKNSWGTDWGENGFGRVIVALNDRYSSYYVEHPYQVNYTYVVGRPSYQRSISCQDRDRDGYCNWGISSSRPTSCSRYCKSQKDCDDSNARLGSFNVNYSCKTL